MTLHEALAAQVAAWRVAGYPCDNFPAIAEMLEWASGSRDSGNERFLRTPQLRALETYWYLRLVKNTPHIVDLYRGIYGSGRDLIEALGLTHQDLKDKALDLGIDGLIEAVKTDDALVKKYKLEALRETLNLDYPSYILALAMGAGKTILIGAIVATEFAMAIESPDGPFVQNALIFAPGKTPIESLRELLSTPYEQILPARFHKIFAASVKFTFTRDGEKDIPVIRGSIFNVVVTNTEKIRIQKSAIRRADLGPMFMSAVADKMDEARRDVANARLRAIASLPHLGIFSDEAHHTYGQSLNTELKKVRKTVDYLHQETNLVCVVNTTGTPYFENQPLRDVVIWYGLSQGIRDNILKDLTDNIHEISVDGDDTAEYLRHVVTTFFKDYGAVALPNGAQAKLAIYFPQTDDLAEYRPAIELALTDAGYSPSLVLVNTSDSSMTSEADITAFNRLNDPAAPHRVILLVNKGTEGWNCPSLFSCALARKLKSSNNFVLQAASRCLRQTPGNSARARIYLSKDNHAVLDKQLRETYGENIADLAHAKQHVKRRRLVLRKSPIAPIRLAERQRRVVRRQPNGTPQGLSAPTIAKSTLTRQTFSPTDSRRSALREAGGLVSIDRPVASIDTIAAATELAARYRMPLLPLQEELKAVYPDDEVPLSHLPGLAEQLELRTRHYETLESTVERDVFLVKESGFRPEKDASGRTLLVTEIAWNDDQDRYLMDVAGARNYNRLDFGFHYDPVEFDSQPERSFFERILHELNLKPQDIEDVYFTGGLTDPAKTDLVVEYRDAAGKVRHYTPDFVIRKKPDPGRPEGSGRVLIVEIKRENSRQDPVDGEHGAKAAAVRRWEELNPERVKYEMIFTPRDQVTYDQMAPVWAFVTPDPVTLPVPIDRNALAEFCHKWHVRELSVFGSVLRADFSGRSDIDMLVTFEPGQKVGLALERMQDELSVMTHRSVDLVTRRSIEASQNWIRQHEILSTARPIYVA